MLILTARDDPLVPVEQFERLEIPDSVTLHVADHGGHIGYLARSGIDADRRWLDWRIVDWATRQTCAKPLRVQSGDSDGIEPSI